MKTRLENNKKVYTRPRTVNVKAEATIVLATSSAIEPRKTNKGNFFSVNTTTEDENIWTEQ
jgi:hypothetical protein